MPFDVKRKFSASRGMTSATDFHPTQPWLLTSDRFGKVTIYDLESGVEIHTLNARSSVNCVKFIPGKNWYVVGSDQGRLHVFDCTTHKEVVAFQAHADAICCLAVHPTSSIILTGSDDKTIKAWDWDKQWHSFQTYQAKSWIHSIAFNHKDPETFATACGDGTVRMWSIASPIQSFAIKAHVKEVNYVDFYPGPDKPYFVTAGADYTVKIWDYTSQSCVQTMEGHTNYVMFAVFHPTLPMIISGSCDYTVRIWNSEMYRLEDTLAYDLGFLRCIALHKARVAVGSDRAIVTFEVSYHKPTFSTDEVCNLVYMHNHEVLSADLQTLETPSITSSDGAQVLLRTKDLGFTEISASCLLYSPDRRFITIADKDKYTIYTVLPWGEKSSGNGISFAWAPDTNTYAVLRSKTDLKIYKNFKKKFVSGMRGVGSFVMNALYTGPLLGVRGPGYVIFWDWELGEIVRKIDVDAKEIYWSTTGTHVVITSSSGLYVYYFDYDMYQDKLDESWSPQGDEDIPESFTLLFTLAGTIQGVKWLEDCLIYATPTELRYSIVSTEHPVFSSESPKELESHTISSINNQAYPLGYIPAHNKVYVVDKYMRVYGFWLSFALVQFQMAVLKADMGTAKELLQNIPKELVSKVVVFLESKDMKELAMSITTGLVMELIVTQSTDKLIAELRGDKAQAMADFLSKIVNGNNALTQRNRKHTLHLLSKLAKSAGVFPQCLELKGVQCNLTNHVAAGGYGFIYKGEHEGSIVCIKAVQVETRGINKKKMRAHTGELIFWGHVFHPNILPFLGIYSSRETVPRICIVSPWMDNGDLLEYLSTVPDIPRKPLVRDIISGLQYLHDLDIIHADLKAENVLVSENGRAMLADFGISRLSITQATNLTHVGAGSIYWMAPELLLDFEPHSRASDIWAFACTCYEIIAGERPFSQHEHPQRLKYAFKKGNITPLEPEESEVGWDGDVWSVAVRCWKSDPASRPKAHELLDMINSFKFPDIRPSDLKSQRNRNDAKVDYDCVFSIIDDIRQLATTTPYQQCITLSMELIANKSTNNLILELTEDEAQRVADFLSKMISDENKLTQRDREYTLSLLSKLSQSAGVLPQCLELKDVQYNFTTPVTSGAHGSIYKGRHEGRPVCVKVANSDPEGINIKKMRAHDGVILWEHLSHSNILPFIGIYFSKEQVSRVCTVSPWMDNGNLVEYLKRVSPIPCKPLVCDIISGLQYLHGLNIIHADLKGSNVVISQSGRALLADFGLSRHSVTPSTTTSYVGVGTACWMAPELLIEDVPPSRESDIWAFACTCYEIITRTVPFGQYRSVPLLIGNFMRGRIVPVKPTPGIGWDEDVWLIAEQCWKSDPASRPKAHELLNMIKAFNYTDDRPEDPKYQIRRSYPTLDYGRIFSILDKIRQSTHT